MKPSDLLEALKVLVGAKRPAFVVSNPGMGKSQIMRKLAKETGRKIFDIRLSGRDVVDLIGLPEVKDGFTTFARPRMLPTEADGPSILFLDEMNRASQMMLNAGLQLLLDHKIGEHELPADCVVMAAGNPESDPGVTKLSAATRLRSIRLDLEVDVTDWMNWAVEAGIEPSVIAFHRFRDGLLHNFDPKAWTSPNPRSWEFVSQICYQNADPRIEHALIVGAIGEAAAVEFSGFRKLYRELPSIDAIVMEPLKTKVPEAPNVRYAIAAALSRRISDTNFGRILQYLERMPVEFNVMAVRAAIGRVGELLTSTPEYTRWIVKHADVTL